MLVLLLAPALPDPLAIHPLRAIEWAHGEL